MIKRKDYWRLFYKISAGLISITVLKRERRGRRRDGRKEGMELLDVEDNKSDMFDEIIFWENWFGGVNNDVGWEVHFSGLAKWDSMNKIKII